MANGRRAATAAEVQAKFDSVSTRLSLVESQVIRHNEQVHNSIRSLWKAVVSYKEEVLKAITDHAQVDADNLKEVYEKLAYRAPLWSTTLITVLAAVIGAGAAWFLK